MLKQILYFILVLLITRGTVNIIYAQKAYKPLKANIKAGTELDKTLKILSDCTKNERYARDPQLYLLQAAAWKKINDTENEKAYLKQSYDTVKLFSSTLGIFESLLKCDSVEQIPDDHGRVQLKSRRKNQKILERYYPNLLNAGKFYLKKKDYNQAYTFLSNYLDVVNTPLLKDLFLLENDELRSKIGFWCLASGYKLRESNKIFKYKDLALTNEKNRNTVLELLSDSYASIGDTTLMIRTLQQGVREYPHSSYFFTTLFDYYNTHKLYDKALLLADTMIIVDKTNVLYKYAKSLSLMNMKAYDACITESMEIISLDSMYAEAYYNVGACYCNRAIDMEKNIRTNVPITKLRTLKLQLKALYQAALPYMEKYRAFKPDQREKWAPVLYQIYLNLNMGSQFDEMEKILKQTVSIEK